MCARALARPLPCGAALFEAVEELCARKGASIKKKLAKEAVAEQFADLPPELMGIPEVMPGAAIPKCIEENREPYFQGEWRKEPYDPRYARMHVNPAYPHSKKCTSLRCAAAPHTVQSVSRPNIAATWL